MSFSLTGGWNEQVTQLTVKLVEDPCGVATGNPKKIYYDHNLIQRESNQPDPGIYSFGNDGASLPPLGCPVYFRVEDFEFSGLLQSITIDNSESERPAYTAIVVDPRQILEGTELIIGDYAGSVNSIPNLLNVFGFLESTGPECDFATINGATLGSPAGAFGGASWNENGLQWNLIKSGTLVLCSTIPATINNFSPYGRLIYKGSFTGGYGVLPYDGAVSGEYISKYLIDIAEVPNAPDYWRITDTSISLLDAITQICDDASYDYFVELMYVPTIGKVIKVRTVSRRVQHDTDTIAQFAINTGVLSSTTGLELRNDKTNMFVVGGNVKSVYQVHNDDFDGEAILPYWGVDDDGNFIPTTFNDDGSLSFTISTSSLQKQLGHPAAGSGIPDLPDTLTITSYDLQAALISYDSWASWISLFNPSLATLLDVTGVIRLRELMDALADEDARAQISNQDFVEVFSQVWSGRPTQEFLATSVYKWYKGYAEQYFGRKYAVRLPYTCVRYDAESVQFLTSDRPATAGWTEFDVLDLPNPSPMLDFFSNEDGTVQCLVRFDSTDWNNTDKRFDDNVFFITLDPTQYGTLNDFDEGTQSATYQYVWFRADVDEKLVFEDLEDFSGPMAIITIPTAAYNSSKYRSGAELVGTAIRLLLQERGETLANAITQSAEIVREVASTVGQESIFVTQTHPFITPSAVAVPLESTINTYGPWYAGTGIGRVRMERDTGLVPWEYGGVDTMVLAGQSKATEGISLQSIGERGTVSVAGYPTTRVGYELGNTPTFVGTTTPLVLGSSTYSYATAAMDSLNGGGNITDINVSVGPGGLVTTYSLSTFTEKFGRFSKYNADRLKKFGRARNEFRRFVRYAVSNEKSLPTNFVAKSMISRGGSIQAFSPNFNTPGDGYSTPHGVLVGQILPATMEEIGDNLYSRAVVVTKKAAELNNELQDYQNKAVMSLDGLVRPVCIGGSSELPHFINVTSYPSDMSSSVTFPTMPPLMKDNFEVNPDLNINPIFAKYLNPFSNPDNGGGYSLSDVHDYANTGILNNGHDIGIVGRASGTGEENIANMYRFGEGEINDWKSSYRFLALRGPIMLQSWGFDTDGKPVPNAVDDEEDCKNGTFVNNDGVATGEAPGGLEDKFLDGWLRKSTTWPVAPVDLRLDRRRGVWVSPPAYRIVIGEIVKVSVTGSVTADYRVKIFTSDQRVSDAEGNVIGTSQPVFMLVDDVVNSQQRHAIGDIVMVYYDVASERGQIINAEAISASTCDLTDDFSTVTDIADIPYVLGLNTAGCIVKMATSACPEV